MKALVVIDMEKEWVNPESEYYIGREISGEIKKINYVIDIFRKRNWKIIFVRHFEEEGDAFGKSSANFKFIDGLDYKEDDALIEKNTISAFYKSNLAELLKGAEEVFICGILTNLCVRMAVEEAYDRDFKVRIIKDCCVSLDKETQDFTLKDLKKTRPEINILDSSDIK